MGSLYESNTFPTHKDASGNIHVLYYPSKANMIMLVDENGRSTDQTLDEYMTALEERLQDLEVSGGGAVITNSVDIAPEDWVEEDGRYKTTILNDLIDDKYHITVDVDIDSIDIAEEAGLFSEFEYVDSSLTLFAESLPTANIEIMYIIMGSSTGGISLTVVDDNLTVSYEDNDSEANSTTTET